MKELENLKELYLDEIKKINKKGELTPTDSEAAKKALEAIEKIEEICACCDDMDEGYSERYYRSSGRGYSQRGRMPEMYRGRGVSMSYRDGYSEGYPMMNDRYPYYRHDGHNGLEVENMIHKLEAMKPDAPDHETKMAIDNVIRKLEAY
ncbi:MAG: hypothetical protein J6I76_00270 [Oribacterium sp.]|nr:hypothetical protein [Oribacterium sp.]